MRKWLKKAVGFVMASVIAATTAFYGIEAPVAKAETSASAYPYRNVMYYGDWSIYAGQNNFYVSKIDGSLITHLNFAFLDVDTNGDLVLCDEFADFQNTNDPVQSGMTYEAPYAGVFGSMAILRTKYPNMKLGVSVGGWTRTGDLPKLGAQESTRKNFARNIAKFVDYLGFDFVDIDWEYPGADRDPDPSGNGVEIDKGCKGSPADTENYTLTLQAIRDELDALEEKNHKHYELSIAMSASPAMMDFIEYDKVLGIVDFANMMTYDLNGAWNPYTGHQTALYTNTDYDPNTQKDGVFSVDTCVKYLKDKYGDKLDYSKIVIGVAPYTRGWNNVQKDAPNAKNPGLYASATGENGVTYAYGAIDSLINQYKLTKYWDDVAKADYFYSEETGYFFTCDTERSVEEKGKYVKENHLGGLISWMASLDSANSITKTMKEALYGDAPIPVQDIVVPAANVSVDVSASGAQYTITIKNNETANESNTALKDAERFKESIVYPKLYIKTKSGATFSAGSEAGQVTNENGIGVVDLQSVYAGKSIEQGKSHTFTVNVSGNAEIGDIESITMTQRIMPNLGEFGAVVVYGDGVIDIPKNDTPASDTGNEGNNQNAGGNEQNTGNEGGNQNAGGNEQSTGNEGSNQNAGGNDQSTGNQAGTGTYEPWTEGKNYAVGDLVSYKDKVYECIRAIPGQVGWEPDVLTEFWKERPDLINVVATDPNDGNGSGNESGTGSESGNGTGSSAQGENNYYVNSKLPQHTVTGYWHNFSNGSTNLRLSEVPAYYDVVCVAFTDNTSTPGEATFSVSEDLQRSIGYNNEQFIEDVKTLKERGQHVLISVGGAEGRIEINSEAASEKFADSMIGIIERFGFEGIDIDFEGSAVSGTQYIASALRKMHDHFGEDFIITMAPETFYMTPGGQGLTSAYWNLAMDIKDILTTVHTQFYNSGSMNGYNGAVANPGNGSFPANLSTLYIESGLRPDQVAIGVPSNGPAASSGQISPAQAANAFNAMINGATVDGFTPPKAYPTFRGLMTWSINWDATQDYAWAKAASEAVKAAPVVENGSTAPSTGGENSQDDTPEDENKDQSEGGVTEGGTTGGNTGTSTEGENKDQPNGGVEAGGTNGGTTGNTTDGNTGSSAEGENKDQPNGGVEAGGTTGSTTGGNTGSSAEGENKDQPNGGVEAGGTTGGTTSGTIGSTTGGNTGVSTEGENKDQPNGGAEVGGTTGGTTGGNTGVFTEGENKDQPNGGSEVGGTTGSTIGGNTGVSTEDQSNVGTTKIVFIKITGISKKIAAGKTIKLKANVYPENATDKRIIWKSSNPKYATVDQNGKVKVTKKGKNKKVTIYAVAADDNEVQASYIIKIMPKAVKKVAISAPSKTVKAGKQLKLKAIVTPNASSKNINKTVKWSSNNTKYATVTQKGVVKAKKAGKGKIVKITAKATDGSNKKKTIQIKIK